MVALVDHWSASMAEGMAIGLDAMGRGTIVGTRMAGCNGGIDNFELPNTKIKMGYPGYKLLHVNGTPREDFVPPVLARLDVEGTNDLILAQGLQTLKGLLERQLYLAPEARKRPAPIPDEEPDRTAHLRAMIQDAIDGTMRASDYTAEMWKGLSPAMQKENQAALKSFGDFISLTLIEHSLENDQNQYRYTLDFKNATLLYYCSFDEQKKMILGEVEDTEWKSTSKSVVR
jgi:hypothetical protein